ncbi:MAG TPA: GAF domain-containing protein, partial [Propionibacteriaceae bacterium]|nr:GAF domain-containing protein [Propionibacteriaceae bacterium]
KGGNGEPGPEFSTDPDEDPRLTVELLMSQLVDQASVIMTAQQRLRRLLIANRSIVQELSLPAVLRRILDTAKDVSGAKYAALGVIGADGLIEEFLHLGLDEDAVQSVPGSLSEPCHDLPKGRGLLGALIKDPKPIRLSRLADDPRSSGIPEGHPEMTTFLGVPIRSRDAVFGNLYLTDRADGSSFTAEDEELILALAATAGIAIENARLYEESRRRQEWLRASGEISRQLLDPEADYSETLHHIATSVKRLASADVVSLVRPTDDDDDETQLEVLVATGAAERELIGLRYPTSNSIAWQAMREGHGVRVQSVDQHPDVHLHLRPYVPVSHAMALPLRGETGPRGAIVAGRKLPRAPFTDADVDMAETFAGQAAIALELSDARADQQRLGVLEDRDRIARDLHDHVIQRLFAAGLSLQSIATTINDGAVDQRLTRTVEELDDTIGQIRNTIFALQEDSSRSLRGTALAVVDQLAPLLPARPDLQLVGPLNTISDDGIITDVEAVLRESLTNVVKHAQANHIRIRLQADKQRLDLTVIDNGKGLGGSTRRSGLANLSRRAERHGGYLDVSNAPEGGLRLQWSIPIQL